MVVLNKMGFNQLDFTSPIKIKTIIKYFHYYAVFVYEQF